MLSYAGTLTVSVITDLAPLMSFVGGSAGDDLRFVKTEVFYGDRVAAHGAVLLVLDAAVPFSVVKTCSFEPTDQTLTITAADAASRVVWEFDGRRASPRGPRSRGVHVPPGRVDDRR